MRKKYLSALLFGALLFASAGTFTSCKDYDDDISNLQSQIDGLATKDDMQAKLDQMQTAVNDAKATAEEALEKANAAGDADKIAELESRIAELEKTLGDIDAMKEEIQNALDSQIAEFRAEMEELLAQVEELTGYSLGMVTSVDLQTNEDAGFDTNLDLNYSRIAQVTLPGNKTANSYEFGKGLTGAFTVEKGDVYTVKDNILASIAPVDAAVSADMVSLINSKGEDLNQYVTYTSEDYLGLLTSRSTANGLREIGVQLKEDVDFEAFHQLVSLAPEGAVEGGYVNYALAVTDTEKERTVTSTYDVTLSVDVEQPAVDIEYASTISSDAHVRGAALAEYPMGEDRPNNDEDCYPAKLGDAFYINVASDLTKGGHVMASYVIVDINNADLSTTDKAAINSLDFEGVNTVSKDNEFAITISGESSGVVVPLKIVTIDYTGVVEENTVWVKAGKEVVGMAAEYTITPTVFEADPYNYSVDKIDAIEKFTIPANATKFSASLTVGEDNHTDKVTYYSDIQNINWGGLSDNGITWFKFYKDAAGKQGVSKASDVAYAEFTGIVNLKSMKEDVTYTGVIKFYDNEGTYLSTNEIKVTKVLPTAVPSYFSAKTNAINNGVLTVYPRPMGGTTGNEFDMNKAFNGFEEASAAHFTLESSALNGLADLSTVSTSDKITKINKDIINNGKTYDAAIYYNYGDIKYQPVGAGVADSEDCKIKWDTDFAIKFGCVPVDSKYSWTVAPEVYYKENTTIAPVTKYDKDGNPVEYGDFVTVKDPYLQAIDPFRDNGTDWEWAMWSPLLQNATVKLITNGDKVNEFFTPSIVQTAQNKYALKLEQTSTAVVLSGDVETTVVFEFTDNFGHKHEISALTFTMKKDHAAE